MKMNLLKQFSMLLLLVLASSVLLLTTTPVARATAPVVASDAMGEEHSQSWVARGQGRNRITAIYAARGGERIESLL